MAVPGREIRIHRPRPENRLLWPSWTDMRLRILMASTYISTQRNLWRKIRTLRWKSRPLPPVIFIQSWQPWQPPRMTFPPCSSHLLTRCPPFMTWVWQRTLTTGWTRKLLTAWQTALWMPAPLTGRWPIIRWPYSRRPLSTGWIVLRKLGLKCLPHGMSLWTVQRRWQRIRTGTDRWISGDSPW